MYIYSTQLRGLRTSSDADVDVDVDTKSADRHGDCQIIVLKTAATAQLAARIAASDSATHTQTKAHTNC